MITEIESATKKYLTTWRAYEKTLTELGLEGPLLATAIGWKVADYQSFRKIHNQLLPTCEQVHTGTVNDRFIGSFVLRNPLRADKVRIIKVLQRRPGSTDPLGLDHLDFYIPSISKAQRVLSKAGAHWELESNNVHQWLSIRFGKSLKYEAKFVDHVVLDAAIAELNLAKKLVLES